MYNDKVRVWAFALDPDKLGDIDYIWGPRMINEWCYYFYFNEDNSRAIVAKHHCTESEIADKPDYLVQVSLFLEGFMTKVRITPENVFVVYVPRLEAHTDNTSSPCIIFLLDMETGELRFVSCVPYVMNPGNMWLDCPSLYG